MTMVHQDVMNAPANEAAMTMAPGDAGLCA